MEYMDLQSASDNVFVFTLGLFFLLMGILLCGMAMDAYNTCFTSIEDCRASRTDHNCDHESK